MNRKAGLLVLALVVLAGAGAAAWYFLRLQPLPPLEEVEIERVTVRFYHPELQKDVQFALPPAFVPRLWDALQPASREGRPGDWPPLGDVRITMKDGQLWYVELYQTPESAVIHYALGPAGEERVPYRGGGRRELEQLLVEAHRAAR